ncbi:TonB-dependent receptor [Desulforhopalus singaporensis]|nr:TonB-dependent receptor [Desulforhopalus singaporensis]
METVVVTAERINEYAGLHPGQVEVMGLEDIQQRNILSVEEVLNNMAGVDVQKSSGTGSRISIRGSAKGGGALLVLINGRPMNSSQYGGVELSTIPIDIVETITVFKPPVPVWLGPGGSDGAICIVTRNSATGWDETKKSVTRIRGAAGSYGRVESGVSQRIQNEQGATMIVAEGMHRDGKQINSDGNSGSLAANWDKQLGDGMPTVEFGIRYYGSRYGSPGPVDNPTPDARQSYRKASVDGRMKGFRGDGGEYSYSLYGDYIDLEDDSQSGMISTLENTKAGFKAENSWMSDDWNLRINGIVEREDVDHTLSGQHHRLTGGLGAQTDRILDDLVMTMGLRGDYTTDFDINPGASWGLNYEMADRWTVKLGAGYSVNIPTFGQLYQPSHGSIDQARGNPDLEEENIWSFDTAIKYQQDKSRQLQLSFFRSDTKDSIVYQRGEDLIYRPLNANRSWRHGVEVTAKYETELGITADADIIIQDSEIEDTDKELPYTPRIKVKLTLFYVLEGLGTKLETTLRYRSKQYSEAENIEAQNIDDYVTTDLKATQPFAIKSVAVEWFVTIQNLFDVDYHIHYGYPDDGFRLLTGLNMTF